MARQLGRASSRERGACGGKDPVAAGSVGREAEAEAGGEEEDEREEEQKREGREGPSSSSSSSSQGHLVAIFCDVCGDAKPAEDVCFDALGCTHLFCFGCLSLRAAAAAAAAAAEEDCGGGGIMPCPVPGCRDGFLDQLLGVAPTVVAAEADEALTYFCSICMERKPPQECFLDIRGCDHVFCAECIAGYVAAKVEENAVASIRCPHPDCSEGLLEPEACRPVIPAPVFERWGAALCEAAVGESSRFYCPYRDCSALLWWEEKKEEEEEEREGQGGQPPMTDALCGHCGRVCCAQCRVPWHEGMTCEEHRRSEKDREAAEKVMEIARDKQWQRCPKCGFVVERVDGCVFIRCRCRHCFCYRCASAMDPKDKKHYCHKCHLTWDNKQAN